MNMMEIDLWNISMAIQRICVDFYSIGMIDILFSCWVIGLFQMDFFPVAANCFVGPCSDLEY